MGINTKADVRIKSDGALHGTEAVSLLDGGTIPFNACEIRMSVGHVNEAVISVPFAAVDVTVKDAEVRLSPDGLVINARDAVAWMIENRMHELQSLLHDAGFHLMTCRSRA